VNLWSGPYDFIPSCIHPIYSKGWGLSGDEILIFLCPTVCSGPSASSYGTATVPLTQTFWSVKYTSRNFGPVRLTMHFCDWLTHSLWSFNLITTYACWDSSLFSRWFCTTEFHIMKEIICLYVKHGMSFKITRLQSHSLQMYKVPVFYQWILSDDKTNIC
jgi:hypothetical protein